MERSRRFRQTVRRYGWILLDRGRHRIRTVSGPPYRSALLPLHEVRRLGTHRVCGETKLCVSHRWWEDCSSNPRIGKHLRRGNDLHVLVSEPIRAAERWRPARELRDALAFRLQPCPRVRTQESAQVLPVDAKRSLRRSMIMTRAE